MYRRDFIINEEDIVSYIEDINGADVIVIDPNWGKDNVPSGCFVDLPCGRMPFDGGNRIILNKAENAYCYSYWTKDPDNIHLLVFVRSEDILHAYSKEQLKGHLE